MLDCNPFLEDLLKALLMRHKAATELGLLSPGSAGKDPEAYLALSGMWLFSEQASSLGIKWRLGRREAKTESMEAR